MLVLVIQEKHKRLLKVDAHDYFLLISCNIFYIQKWKLCQIKTKQQFHNLKIV